MTILILYLAALILLSGIFSLHAMSCSFSEIPQKESEGLLDSLGKAFFYRPIHRWLFQKDFKALFFKVVTAEQLYRCLFGIVVFYCVIDFVAYPKEGTILNGIFYGLAILIAAIYFVALIYFGDILPRICSAKLPEKTLYICAPLASIFLYAVLPLNWLLLKLFPSFAETIYFDHFQQEPETQAQQEVFEIMQRAQLSTEISRHEKQLIESVFNFRKRIVREVMVPRIETFALDAGTSMRDAAKLVEREGYSRIPIYKEGIDNIIGIVMYKDILSKYTEYTEKGNDSNVIDAPIESIMKPALYTPEMKKISNLLQEFRKQQVHLAVVIDEYGGTEGIVTIEDILEEIVGEIADEYDQEEELFEEQPDHSWIVDARLNIFDAEELFDIKIPQDGEYDTIGGYIYHRAGTIPAEGFVIHHEDFEIEVIASSGRAVDKVRIKKTNIAE